jgi:hypothetical protein
MVVQRDEPAAQRQKKGGGMTWPATSSRAIADGKITAEEACRAYQPSTL